MLNFPCRLLLLVAFLLLGNVNSLPQSRRRKSRPTPPPAINVTIPFSQQFIPPARVDYDFSFTLHPRTFTIIDSNSTDFVPSSLTDNFNITITTPLPAWLNFDASIATLYGTPQSTDIGLVKLNIQATDSKNRRTTDTLPLVVTYDNSPPTINRSIRSQLVSLVAKKTIKGRIIEFKDQQIISLPIQEDFYFAFDQDSFRDGDNSLLGYYAFDYFTMKPPKWLKFSVNDKSFRGMPSVTDVGMYKIVIGATDGAGSAVNEGGASDSFLLKIGNRPPMMVDQLEDLEVKKGLPFEFRIPSGMIQDPDRDLLMVTVRRPGGGQIPDWITFDSQTLKFAGTPPTNAVSVEIVISVTDPENASAAGTFNVVLDGNYPPLPSSNCLQLSNCTLNTTAYTGKSFYYQLPIDAFTDKDGDTLRFEVDFASSSSSMSSTSWISFNQDSRSFSGIPPDSIKEPDDVIVTVKAYDNRNATSQLQFNIHIDALSGTSVNVVAVVLPILLIFGVGGFVYFFRQGIPWRGRHKNRVANGKSEMRRSDSKMGFLETSTSIVHRPNLDKPLPPTVPNSEKRNSTQSEPSIVTSVPTIDSPIRTNVASALDSSTPTKSQLKENPQTSDPPPHLPPIVPSAERFSMNFSASEPLEADDDADTNLDSNQDMSDLDIHIPNAPDRFSTIRSSRLSSSLERYDSLLSFCRQSLQRNESQSEALVDVQLEKPVVMVAAPEKVSASMQASVVGSMESKYLEKAVSDTEHHQNSKDTSRRESQLSSDSRKLVKSISIDALQKRPYPRHSFAKPPISSVDQTSTTRQVQVKSPDNLSQISAPSGLGRRLIAYIGAQFQYIVPKSCYSFTFSPPSSIMIPGASGNHHTVLTNPWKFSITVRHATSQSQTASDIHAAGENKLVGCISAFPPLHSLNSGPKGETAIDNQGESPQFNQVIRKSISFPDMVKTQNEEQGCWLKYDEEKKMFSGVPSFSDIGEWNVEVSAMRACTDGDEPVSATVWSGIVSVVSGC